MSSLCSRISFVACLCLTATVPWASGAPHQPVPARVDQHDDSLPPGVVARLGTTRLRHGGNATRVAFSPDGATVAASGPNHTVIFWETATGKEVRRIPARSPGSFLFTADGKHLVVGERPDGIYLLDAASGKDLRPFQARGVQAEWLVLSPDSRFALSARTIVPPGPSLPPGVTLPDALKRSNEVVLWLGDVTTGQEVRRFRIPNGTLTSLVFCPDGKRFVSACPEDGVRLWEAATGQVVRHFLQPAPNQPPRPSHRVHLVVVSADGKTAVVADNQGPITLWDVGTGKEVGRLPEETRGVLGMTLSMDGRFLAASHGDGSVRVWGLASGKQLRRWEAKTNMGIFLAFSPDSKALAMVNRDLVVHLYDVSADRELDAGGGHAGAIRALAFFPDGKRLVSAGSDRSIRVWETAGGKEVARLNEELSDPNALAIAPDGQTVLLAQRGNFVRRWKPGSAPESRPLEGYRGVFHCQTVSSEGKTLAGFGPDYVVRLWDAATGKGGHTLKEHQGLPTRLVLSPDGTLLAAIGHNQPIRFWDTATGVEARPANQVTAALSCFSPDGRAFAGGSEDVVGVWEVATGKERARFRRPSQGYASLGFSADGRLLLVGTPDGNLLLHDLATGKEVGQFSGDGRPIRHIACSPDGKAAATGSEDGMVLIWDMAVLAQRLPVLGTDLSALEVQRFWVELGSDDAERAGRAIRALIAAPAQTVPFLKEKLPVGGTTDPKRVARLIADLEADSFATREGASNELAELGKAVEPALQRAMQGNPTAEVRRRLQEILEKVKEGAVKVNPARGGRALEVLEHVGNAEARQVLEALAKGDENSPLARGARATLERLARRPGAAP